jgi:hypothetical protein
VVEGVAVPVLVVDVTETEVLMVVVVDGTGSVPLIWYMLRKLPLPQVWLVFPAQGMLHELIAACLLAAFMVLPQ